MIKDHRPYYMKKLYYRLQDMYVNHLIKPQFTSLGKGHQFIRPWNMEVIGEPIVVGKHAYMMGEQGNKIKLVIWSANEDFGKITIGDYCLVSPGVRITSAHEIRLGNNCMLAKGAYITDADWHGIYDRVESIGDTAPVILEDNVWIGDSAIVCKGVTIGENSIIGAGSIVTHDIPPNSIAVGNPAKVVKELDPTLQFTKRQKMFENPKQLAMNMDSFDKHFLKGNTTLGWLRSILFPRKGD